jgi:tRNA-2-methylthio-N6-dimethylallyladenosine synthase
MLVQNEISFRRNQALLGKVLEVLVEGESKNNKEKLTGRTRSNGLVVFPGPKSLEGQLVSVKIVEAGTWTLEGELVGIQD